MKKKLSLIIAAIMLTTLVVSSCNNSDSPSEPSSSDTSVSQPSSESEETPESSSPTVQIYDPETQQVSKVPVEEGESNAAAVTDEQLIEVLNDRFAFEAGGNEFKIIINSIEEEGTGLHIDFAGNSLPAVSMGSTDENTCLISIAETLLQNHPSCSEVYYSIDGGAYMSGHIELDINEPFRYDSQLAQ